MRICFSLLTGVLALYSAAAAQIAVVGETVHTSAGAPITNGVVLVRNGKIESVGPASSVRIPAGYRTVKAAVVTPGLIDAHSVVGLGGYLNQPHDQDQREASAPIQPDLRAMDAYNARERLVEWVRGFGVTTVHTGHGPGALVSGQTMIVKTRAEPVARSVLVPEAMLAVTIGDSARVQQGKSPGTRAKMLAMLRSELLKAQDYARKREKDNNGQARDLRLDVLRQVLNRELPLLVTAQRARDILSALRLAEEFNIRVVLDGAAEAPLVMDEIKRAGVPVIVHPTMYRSSGETENLSFETAAKLHQAGIPFALQSGFEAYVPKTRVVLFEAAVAAANGLGPGAALDSITIGAARLLGIDKRAGSLEPGKDADIALYDGDPFEYTTHCTGVMIDGELVSEESR
ncbi:MAG: amidohydrolase family protein [Bryobacteraceae bacterium]|nr:amidohydrolase family protein [Bryobacteraceae bacterium]